MTTLLEFWHQLYARPDFWGFISIPIVAAVVTWAHVWCAIQMVFYPIEFLGVRVPLVQRLGINYPGIGWQGIIPRKSRKMAGIVTDKAISKLGTVGEFLRQMEPDMIAARVVESVASNIEAYTDEVMREKNGALWDGLPEIIKRQVYNHARNRLPAIMDSLVHAIIRNVDELVDIRAMVCDQFEKDKALIVTMFQEVGKGEFAFIINVSFWIGLGFGFVQMVLYYFIPWHLGLPLYAAVLGYLTNWIALAMVFRPLEEKRLGPFRFQGVFLKRQNDVADKFSELVASEVLTLNLFMREMMTGPRTEKTTALIRQQLGPLLDAPIVRMLVQVSMGGSKGYAELKETIAAKSATMALLPLSDPEFNRGRATLLTRLLSERIRALSKAEFQDLLRPAFQEDEWILLVLGFVTGFAAGVVQLLVGFK